MSTCEFANPCASACDLICKFPSTTPQAAPHIACTKPARSLNTDLLVISHKTYAKHACNAHASHLRRECNTRNTCTSHLQHDVQHEHFYCELKGRTVLLCSFARELHMHCTGFHIDRTAWRALWAIRWSDACGVEANMAGQTPFPRIFEIEGQGVSSRPCWHSNSSVVFAQHCSSSSSSSPHIGQSVTSLSQLQKVIKISKKPKPKTYFPHHSFSNAGVYPNF